MNRPPDRRLFVLAADRRAGIAPDLFPTLDPHERATSVRVTAAKAVIVDGFMRAIELGAPPGAGLLIDEEYGAVEARRAIAAGAVVALPVERAGLDWFELEYGDEFAAHIEAFDPTFVKALVRFNPDGDPEPNGRSLANLAALSRWLVAHDRALFLELLVPATLDQLVVTDGSDGYTRRLLPGLLRRAVAEMQAAGIEAQIWKIEGLEARSDYESVAEQMRADGRDDVGFVVLGAGADAAQVERWLRAAIGVPGAYGFAIGRTIWWDPLTAHLRGDSTRSETVAMIAASFRHFIDVWNG